MKQTPDIAIYRDGIQYRVEIEGKEIERLTETVSRNFEKGGEIVLRAEY